VKGKKVYDNNCTLPEPPKPPCVTAITDHAVSAQYVAGNPFRAYVAYTGGQLCKDVTRTVSLNSYATDGPTWETSGTQVFVDHASITLSQGNTSGYLQVKAPSCYYQTDLYFGSTLFDGTHGDLPHYPGSVTPQPLIAARNGGHACPPPVVKPTGTFSVTCSAQGATVTVGTLSPGNQSHVVWTLKVNGDSVLVSSGQMVQVPAKAHLALSYRIGSAEPVTKQEQDAPAACPPTPTPTPTATTPTPTPTATTPTPTPTPTATTPTPTPTATTPTPTPTATTPTPTPTTSTPTTSTPTTSTTPTTSGTPSATDTPTDETSVLPTKIGKTPTTPTTPDTPSGSVLPHTGGSALAATTVIGVGLLLGGLLLTLWGRKRKEVIARRH
jgi:LPXTG-motif cell wall-anchored protein